MISKEVYRKTASVSIWIQMLLFILFCKHILNICDFRQEVTRYITAAILHSLEK